MNIIEIYSQQKEGYDPFLIREGWQVARLTHMPAQDLSGIQKMDKHFLTDEVFILLNGTAVLIGGVEEHGDFRFEWLKMQQGIPYNIPAGTWHNIAMSRDAELIIVERDGTHLGDYEYKPLNSDQIKRVNDRIRELTQR